MPRTKKPHLRVKFWASGLKDFKRLNIKQQKFVYEFFLRPVTGKTQTQCYMEAFGHGEENRRNCRIYASQLIARNPKVGRLIEKIRDRETKKLGLSAYRLLREECKIAFSDVADLFDAEGNWIKDPTKLPEHIRGAIAGLDVIENNRDKTTTYKYKLWDKGRALDRLHKIQKSYAPKEVQVSTPEGKPIQTNNVTANTQIDPGQLPDDVVKILAGIMDKEVMEE